MSSMFGPYDIKPPSWTYRLISYIAGMWCVAAKSMIRLRLRIVSASATKKRASGRSRVMFERAASMSSGPRTPRGWTFTFKTCAARDQAGGIRVAWYNDNDRDGRSRCLGSLGSRRAGRQQQIDIEANQLSGQPRQPLELGFRPSAYISYVFAADVTKLLECLSECRGWNAIRWAGAVGQKSDKP